MQTYYLIRHCEATGQAADAPLTAQGQKQAVLLADFFKSIPVDRILSSPFRRAYDTSFSLSNAHDCPIELENRFQERILSTSSLNDWRADLKATFSDLNLQFPGGESSHEAMDRTSSVLHEAFLHPARHTVLVTHGNAMALLLKSIDSNFGYPDWEQLRNPDIYRLVKNSEGLTFERLPFNEQTD
ncbi:histidine phosphatase family protein [Exiguobacterium artemiae]|uniref:histidine phosphatase family protein n=1 Tax=Exiguobacterium artemiae TaxID=340145 RepID=UPI003D01C270